MHQHRCDGRGSLAVLDVVDWYPWPHALACTPFAAQPGMGIKHMDLFQHPLQRRSDGFVCCVMWTVASSVLGPVARYNSRLMRGGCYAWWYRKAGTAVQRTGAASMTTDALLVFICADSCRMQAQGMRDS